MKPEEAKEYLRTQFADQLELVESYINEAEHQDGEGYWDGFESLSQLGTDFQLYVKSLEE